MLLHGSFQVRIRKMNRLCCGRYNACFLRAAVGSHVDNIAVGERFRADRDRRIAHVNTRTRDIVLNPRLSVRVISGCLGFKVVVAIHPNIVPPRLRRITRVFPVSGVCKTWGHINVPCAAGPAGLNVTVTHRSRSVYFVWIIAPQNAVVQCKVAAADIVYRSPVCRAFIQPFRCPISSEGTVVQRRVAVIAYPPAPDYSPVAAEYTVDNCRGAVAVAWSAVMIVYTSPVQESPIPAQHATG